MIAFAFEIEDGIGDMFQRLRACNRAFFGHMSNNKNGDMCAFRQLHQLQRTFAYLADTARRGCQMTGEHGLDRIDDDAGRVSGDGLPRR